MTDRDLFNYCKDRRYFANILPYTRNLQALLSPAFDESSLSWRIIGGGVPDSFESNFITVAQRHIERYVQNVDLGEVEPVAFLENTFIFEDEIHTHKGILFIGRVRNFDKRSLLESLPSSRGHFVPFSTDGREPNLPQTYQQAAFRVACRTAREALAFVNQDHEIDSNERHRARYEFHRLFIKPIMKLASKLFGKVSISEFEQKVEQEILSSDPSSVFDIACGENISLVDLVKKQKISLFLGNDISWSQIKLIDDSFDVDTFRNNNGLIFFTNNDGRRLPFADDAFDVGICKNALHHMPDSRSVRGLISELKRVSKKAIVIDILDPKFEGRWGQLRHRYYMKFLKDAGGNFLSRDEFQGLANEFNPSHMYEIATFRAVYQFAIFDRI